MSSGAHDHEHDDHDGHDHAGHDHAGHDHARDHGDHDGHDHDGHDHDGHDHAGHAPTADRAPQHGKFTAREARQAKRLAMVLGIVGVFFVFEAAGAIAARSVVLQADALHLLTDELALAMSLLAMRLAVRRPTPRFTFGLRRAEPVAALFNSFLVLVATAEIVSEGIAELRGHGEPQPYIMLIVAAGALVANGLSAWLLHGAIHDHGGEHDHGHGHSHDKSEKKGGGHALNLRGAWLHLLGDALGAIAALVAAVIIAAGGPVSVDAIASFVVAAILIAAVSRLVRDAALVLLEAAPVHLPVGSVREVILAFPGIAAVHDLHVWTLGAGHDAITTHVRASTLDPTIGRRLSRKLRDAFETEYVTVQVESAEEECAGESGEGE